MPRRSPPGPRTRVVAHPRPRNRQAHGLREQPRRSRASPNSRRVRGPHRAPAEPDAIRSPRQGHARTMSGARTGGADRTVTVVPLPQPTGACVLANAVARASRDPAWMREIRSGFSTPGTARGAVPGACSFDGESLLVAAPVGVAVAAAPAPLRDLRQARAVRVHRVDAVAARPVPDDEFRVVG